VTLGLCRALASTCSFLKSLIDEVDDPNDEEDLTVRLEQVAS
jgi:hypothetical protein